MATGRVAPVLVAAALAALVATGAPAEAQKPLSELGYPDCPDVFVPQAAADGLGGGRALRDYVDDCTGVTAQAADGGTGLRAEFGTVLLIVMGFGILAGIALAVYVRRTWEP